MAAPSRRSGSRGASAPRRGCGLPRAVGVLAGPGQLATFNNQVLVPDRSTGEITLEDLTGAGAVAGLRGEGRTGRVRSHSVVRHRPPRMVPRRGRVLRMSWDPA